eukprot:CAMPEP_0171811388 /NCGR_PEP_ID=MMETSP0991-20121206/78076_1 /TAXON_ID=483369 /ORGANISM="non described non described, Strain CCMP2098" /LENGTH=117 /DNA_ID=CAMNT_0012424741 /DNA_START=235 /DNA_END=588 /DNA_ORIENTATION=+
MTRRPLVALESTAHSIDHLHAATALRVAPAPNESIQPSTGLQNLMCESEVRQAVLDVGDDIENRNREHDVAAPVCFHSFLHGDIVLRAALKWVRTRCLRALRSTAARHQIDRRQGPR